MKTTFKRAARAFLHFSIFILPFAAFAATNDLSGLLQKGLFEEEANRNLDAASAAYESLVKQLDKDRQIGATAVFRLGEVYRKQGKTNEAAAQYERIVRDFAEQTTLVTLSRQNLAGLRPPEKRSTWTPSRMRLNQMRDDIERFQQMITGYQALPETNRLDSLCALFANDDEIAVACKEVALVRTSLNRLLRDDLTLNHPSIVKLQTKLKSLEAKIETSAREKIGQLVPLVASLEKELQRREALEESTPGTTASSNSDPDLAQLKKLSRAELLQVLPTLAPDQLLTKLLEQQSTTATKYTELSHDLGPISPELKKLVAVQELLNKQIDERVAGILKAIELRSSASGASKPTGTVSTVLDEEEAEIRRIQAMIQNSPDLINAPSGDPTLTPLCRAARNGHVRVAKFLLDGSAAIDRRSNGSTPLHYAVSAGHRAMTEFLLQRGADPGALNNFGQTALHVAAEKGFQAVAETLLTGKAAINAVSSRQETPLHLAAGRGHVDLVKFLISKGANLDMPGEDGGTLVKAASGGHSETLAVLLAAKANPNLTDKSGRTALSYAAGKGHFESVKALLASGANPNAGSNSLPLHLAIHAKSPAIVEALLRADADANRTTTVKWPISIGSTTWPEGGPATPLFIAVNEGNVDAVRLLLQFKADPNGLDLQQKSLLFHATGNFQILKALIEAGADANTRNSDGIPLLFFAAGDENAVQLLLERGARVDARDRGQQTALFWAVDFRNIKSAQLLITGKVDVNAQSSSGWTALHRAIRAGHLQLVELLLANGADPNLRNNEGNTPLDYVKADSKLPQTPRPANEVRAEPKELAAVLRKHGALDELPDFTRIRITRQGLAQPLMVFSKGSKLTNQFTLLEVVMNFYRRPSVVTPSGTVEQAYRVLPFPDFGRIIIRRPSQKPGGTEQEIKVSLLNASNVVDCARDVPVEFGDVIEIPERVHALNEAPTDLVQEMERVFMEANRTTFPERQLQGVPGMETNATMVAIRSAKAARKAEAQRWTCLQKAIQLVVAGERTPVTVDSWKEGFLGQALAKPEARTVLRSSSDLSRVKVTRQDAKTGKPVVLIVDVANILQPGDDLWLRDGDVIEVPDKP